MPQFRAICLCQVDNTLRQEDDVFEYNGPYNGNLEPVDGSDWDAPVAKGREISAAVDADEEEAPTPAKKWTPKAKRAPKARADAGAA